MRRLSVFGALALLVLALVPLASATPAPANRYVAGNIKVVVTGDASLTGMFQFEVRTSPSGALQFGYYQTDAMTGWWAGSRSHATVNDVTFFKAESGADAARLGGVECSIANPDPTVIGQCGEYALIVTDGAAVDEADTFCGGPPDDPCRFRFDVVEGDITIYGMP